MARQHILTSFNRIKTAGQAPWQTGIMHPYAPPPPGQYIFSRNTGNIVRQYYGWAINTSVSLPLRAFEDLLATMWRHDCGHRAVFAIDHPTEGFWRRPAYFYAEGSIPYWYFDFVNQTAQPDQSLIINLLA